MYLQEPSTPLKPYKKKNKKNRAKAVDDQVSEFLALENCSFEQRDSGITNQEKWLVICESDDELRIDERIDNWLNIRCVIKDVIESVKNKYFIKKNEFVSRKIDRSPKANDECPSPFSSPCNLHWFMAKSKLGSRRLGFGATFTYLVNGGIEEEFTLHKIISMESINEFDSNMVIDEVSNLPFSEIQNSNL